MSPGAHLLLFVAAALGGALNSVAGGGSFLTFPALVMVGVPPVAANATSTLALWPGSVASAVAYRRALDVDRAALAVTAGASLAGGVAGAALLLRTSDRTFVALVPWLLLVATALFAIGPRLGARLRAGPRARRALVAVAAAQLLIAVYGGYFGGGIGILMLASFTLLGLRDVHAMNALKTVLTSVVNGVALAIFLARGAVVLEPGLVMVAGGVAGGWAGARVAQRVDARRVRAFVLVLACLMTGWFFARPYLTW